MFFIFRNLGSFVKRPRSSVRLFFSSDSRDINSQDCVVPRARTTRTSTAYPSNIPLKRGVSTFLS